MTVPTIGPLAPACWRTLTSGALTTSRKVFDVNGTPVPVVAFSLQVTGEDGRTHTIEVGLRKDAIDREEQALSAAISSMFRLSLWITVIAFALALGIVGWAGLARMIRGQILAVREKEFVTSAQAIGLPSWKIILKYLIPNALSPIIVALSMGMGGIALTEGILSYLGIGLQPPNPSWGNIIADNAGRYWRMLDYGFDSKTRYAMPIAIDKS